MVRPPSNYAVNLPASGASLLSPANCGRVARVKGLEPLAAGYGGRWLTDYVDDLRTTLRPSGPFGY